MHCVAWNGILRPVPSLWPEHLAVRKLWARADSVVGRPRRDGCMFGSGPSPPRISSSSAVVVEQEKLLLLWLLNTDELKVSYGLFHPLNDVMSAACWSLLTKAGKCSTFLLFDSDHPLSPHLQASTAANRLARCGKLKNMSKNVVCVSTVNNVCLRCREAELIQVWLLHQKRPRFSVFLFVQRVQLCK